MTLAQLKVYVDDMVKMYRKKCLHDTFYNTMFWAYKDIQNKLGDLKKEQSISYSYTPDIDEEIFLLGKSQEFKKYYYFLQKQIEVYKRLLELHVSGEEE